ncbi:MAG: type II toxin-antitoxin system RelE/ParE family toxin [Bacteroidetes bacterium]|nr:type II toxin-antitoxin system RelE/ParE family toxin [Bacteroidota bacterium]MBU1678639.1 type II toxin-antitoxin system RelE/ParE family toxin [Bacteroidota bacterium]
MNIEFLNPAEDEFVNAIAYYNLQSEGLGFEFAVEVKRTIGRIIQYPDAWTPLSRRTRRCRTNRFPYGIIYQVRTDTLLIVSVMHLHRDPKTWRSRLKPEEL